MSDKTTARTLLAVTAVGLGLAWYIKKGKENSHPMYDSFGQTIDYNHSISYIKPSTDPQVIQDAYASWKLEEKIRQQILGDQYMVKPFDVTNYYGKGYRDTPTPNPVVHTPVQDPGPGAFRIPIFQMEKNFIL